MESIEKREAWVEYHWTLIPKKRNMEKARPAPEDIPKPPGT